MFSKNAFSENAFFENAFLRGHICAARSSPNEEAEVLHLQADLLANGRRRMKKRDRVDDGDLSNERREQQLDLLAQQLAAEVNRADAPDQADGHFEHDEYLFCNAIDCICAACTLNQSFVC